MTLSIAIVTPSFNQAAYLEAAIRSVLEQNYAPLEYVVMDGGSSDGSAEIIERYSSRLTAWSSAPDGGQYAAVAAGFAKTRGEVMGWLNSDDAYLPGALSVVGEIFAQFPEIEWLTTLCPLHWDERGRAVRAAHARGFSRDGFFSGEHLPEQGAFSLGHIQQESTFWRRSLWERAGARFDPEFPLAGDFALWARFFQLSNLVSVATPVGGFRAHPAQKTARDYPGYHAEAARALEKYGGHRARLAIRPWRELGTRLPVMFHPLLAKIGAVRRARVVQWAVPAGGWTLEERFI